MKNPLDDVCGGMNVTIVGIEVYVPSPQDVPHLNPVIGEISNIIMEGRLDGNSFALRCDLENLWNGGGFVGVMVRMRGRDVGYSDNIIPMPSRFIEDAALLAGRIYSGIKRYEAEKTDGGFKYWQVNLCIGHPDGILDKRVVFNSPLKGRRKIK